MLWYFSSSLLALLALLFKLHHNRFDSFLSQSLLLPFMLRFEALTITLVASVACAFPQPCKFDDVHEEEAEG